MVMGRSMSTLIILLVLLLSAEGSLEAGVDAVPTATSAGTDRDMARQSGSEGPSIRIRIRDRVVAIVFLLIDAGKRYV